MPPTRLQVDRTSIGNKIKCLISCSQASVLKHVTAISWDISRQHIPYRGVIEAKYSTAQARSHSLAMCDIDMPQRGFDDIEGADVTYLHIVLPAELFPSRPNNTTTILLPALTTNLPRIAVD
jgi:hypothetical protein